MQMMTRQSVRIAGFVFAGAVALAAQPARVPALTKTAQNPPASAPIVSNSQAPSDDLIKNALTPVTSKLAADDHASYSNPAGSSKSWFATGPGTFPGSIRMNPAFGLPLSQYGAAPAAVQFSFGKK
jgi:hypothetical protein